MIKLFVIFSMSVSLSMCNIKSEKKDFEHNYAKYWDKYSEQQLKDTLYSDPSLIKSDADSDWTGREFYVNTTNELLSDLKDDNHSIDSLFPMVAFEEVTIQKITFGFKRTFTIEQITRLLEIVNDPVSFNWAETTYEPELRVDFIRNHKVVASLEIGAGRTVIKPTPDWPEFKKMKFGCLKSEAYDKLTKLLYEMGYKPVPL